MINDLLYYRANMIENLNKINAGAINPKNVVSGSRSNYTKQEVLCGLPDSDAGRLQAYIAQKALPDKKLMKSIIESCRKHYLFVKYKRQWTNKARDLYDDEVDRLTYIVIWTLASHTEPTVRELAKITDIKRATFHDNQYDVYLELRNYIGNQLSIAHRHYSKKNKKI